MAIDANTIGAARAGGAIATALIEVLHDKGILSLEDARAVLDRSLKAIGGSGEGAVEATQIIAGMMKGRFSARRQDP
jgi:hypothetical protein